MIVRMNHMSFTVSDLERSVEFYQKVLGLNLLDIGGRDPLFSEKVTGVKGADLRVAYLGTSNCAVELIQYLSPKGKKIDTRTCNIGSAHVCFVVDNFQAMIDNLRKNNVVFSGEPSIVPGGPNKGKAVLYFEDPDSNTIEFLSDGVVDEKR
jgi:glyoxylase I family protein